MYREPLQSRRGNEGARNRPLKLLIAARPGHSLSRLISGVLKTVLTPYIQYILSYLEQLHGSIPA